jgi:TonB family protein
MHIFRLSVCAITFVLTLVASGQQPVGDSNSAKAQSEPAMPELKPGSSRLIVSRVRPEYPRMAAALKLSGTVQLLVVVRPDGAVKQVRVVGGHPVLAEAATAAVMKWRFQKGAKETTESVKLSFGE